MASMLDILEKAANEASEAYAAAEREHLEAAAKAAALRDEAQRLKAAVAALSGPTEEAKPKKAPKKAAEVPDPNNPLAHHKCLGCGVVGSTQGQLLQTRGGVSNILVCTRCGNQTF